MILLIDNYDSFVYNLSRYVTELGHETIVVRNDKVSVDQIAELCPNYIIISPGPCTPTEAGIAIETIQRFGKTIPILGVCLGHQAIGQAFGGRIIKAKQPMHGKASKIVHDGIELFDGIPNQFSVARYHSLSIEPESLPNELRVTALSECQEIMAIQHKKYPIYGVQFHPESVLTQYGYQVLKNFLYGNA